MANIMTQLSDKQAKKRLSQWFGYILTPISPDDPVLNLEQLKFYDPTDQSYK